MPRKSRCPSLVELQTLSGRQGTRFRATFYLCQNYRCIEVDPLQMRSLLGEQIGVFVQQNRISSHPFDLEHVLARPQGANPLFNDQQVDLAPSFAEHRLIALFAQKKRRQLDVRIEFNVTSFNFVADQEGQRLEDGRILGNTGTDLIVQAVALVDDVLGGQVVQNETGAAVAVRLH